jgi:hypothetical protein
LTLGSREPAALLAGAVLAAALVKETFNPFGPAPTSYDKGVETQAIKSVVMTSNTNRVIRLLLGAVYVYAAVTFAIWMVNPREDSSKLVSRLQTLELKAFGELSLAWVACVVNFFVAGIWLSSGWCGQ